MSQHFVIIGAGPAGEAAAKTLRKLSKATPGFEDLKITVVEKEQPGGLCLNKGCIPSKTLLEKIKLAKESGKPIDWSALQEFKNAVVGAIRNNLTASFKTLKIDLLQGSAQFVSENEIEVISSQGTQTLSFDKALIATGTDIFFPPPLDQFKSDLLTSDTLLTLQETPKSILIVGGGAVGLEFACLLNALGTHVTVVEAQEGILPGEDPAIVSALARDFSKRGVVFKTGTTIKSLKKNVDGWEATLKNEETLSIEKIAACVGRFPNHASLQLEKAGVEISKGRLIADVHLQTKNKNIFSAGDALNTRLAHAAAAQAEIAAKNMLGANETFDDALVPRALYSWPEVASVGAWKYELEGLGKPVKTARAFFKGSAKAMAAEETDGFIQIVFDPETDALKGAQIIGPKATELIHVFSVALKANMTRKDLSTVIFAHPTLSESIKEATLR